MAVRSASITLLTLATWATAQSTASPYGQCGGIGYSGPSSCGSGYTCTSYNSYYYQCYPGTGTVATTPVTSSTSGTTTTTTPTTSATSSTGGSSPITTSTLAPSSTATLSPGYSWIRAVESPYYHSYLQPMPTTISSSATTTPAILGPPGGAGQFTILSGQLLYSASPSQTLYMHVEDPADKTQRALATWFENVEAEYGSFAFSGDTVTWSVEDIARPNTGAWYVCNGTTGDGGWGALFVNTGAYAYDAPEGCSDETIHSYGGSTADV